MPIMILIGVLVILIALFTYTQFKKSSKFESFVKDITEEVDTTPKFVDGVIKDISAAEKELVSKRIIYEKESEKLQKESVKIGDFLAQRSGSKSEVVVNCKLNKIP